MASVCPWETTIDVPTNDLSLDLCCCCWLCEEKKRVLSFVYLCCCCCCCSFCYCVSHWTLHTRRVHPIFFTSSLICEQTIYNIFICQRCPPSESHHSSSWTRMRRNGYCTQSGTGDGDTKTTTIHSVWAPIISESPISLCSIFCLVTWVSGTTYLYSRRLNWRCHSQHKFKVGRWIHL